MGCLSLKYGDSETALDPSQSLRQFRIELRRVETAKVTQTSSRRSSWTSSLAVVSGVTHFVCVAGKM